MTERDHMQPEQATAAGETPRRGRPRGAATRKQVLLRLDPAVHEALTRWADDELRSVNAQIELTLRRALQEAGRMPKTARPMRGRGRPPAE